MEKGYSKFTKEMDYQDYQKEEKITKVEDVLLQNDVPVTILVIFGTNCLRMDQVKVVEDSL